MAKKRTKTPRRDPLDSTSIEDDSISGADATATKAWQRWKESRDHTRAWRMRAVESYDFVIGRQWTTEEIQALEEQQRPVVTFNRTAPTVDAVSGYEINGRQDVTFLPREPDDSGGAQVQTEAGKYFRQQCDAEDNESDAFHDLLTTGLGVVEHRMDYDENPEGMLAVDRVDPLEMAYDPAAAKRNLLDRRWDIRGKWWNKPVAEAMWPDHDFSEANNIQGDLEDTTEKEPLDREAAAFYKDTGIGEEYERKRGKVFILEYTWFENEKFTSAANPQTGKLEEVADADLKKINEMLAERGMPALKSVKRTRRKFKRAFIHGRTTLEEDDAPCPDRFHYQFMTGKRDRNKNHWYGIVEQMKDPQRWANKWLSQTLHIMNSGVKGTTEFEEGAFERPDDIEKKIAKPGAMIKIEAGYFDKVRVRPAMGLPPTTMNLTEFAIGSIRDATGVNVEVLGLANRDQPGVVEHSRKQSAMAILAPLFNSLRNYRKQAGRLTLYFIKEYMSDGRLIRIVGQGAAKYIPLTKQAGFDSYDVIVDESPSSPNQKEMVFGSLASVLPALMKQGVPVPPELLDYVPGLPAQLVEKWKALLEKGPSPEQQAAGKLAEEEKRADINKTNADALLSETKATGEMAKIVPMLQQVLAGLAQLSGAIPGGAPVAAPTAPEAIAPLMPPPDAMAPPPGLEPPVPPQIPPELMPPQQPPMVPNA